MSQLRSGEVQCIGVAACGAVANSSAGGIYDFADNSANEQAFLVSEK